MDSNETRASQEITLTEKIGQLNAAITAFKQWDQERLAGQSAARTPPEMTSQQRLGEALSQAEKNLKTETPEELAFALSDTKENPYDDDQTKLIKLHQARVLAHQNPPILSPGTPERTLKILDVRPDLLEHPDIYYKYTRVLLQDQRLPQLTQNLLKNLQGAELPPPPVMEITRRLSEADPTSSFAVLEGFMQGVIAYKDGPTRANPNLIRTTDRKADSYPLDQLTSTLPQEKASGFLGSGTMKGLAERSTVWKKDQFPLRGKASLMGAALTVTLAGSLDARRNSRNPSVENGIQDNFVTVIDTLLGDKQLKELAQDRQDPLYAVSQIILTTDAKLATKLNARDLKVRDRLRPTQEADRQQLARLQEKVAKLT